MNEFQSKLYADLLALTANDAFYHQDFVLDGASYRIFNYRLSSYSDFLNPSALECRGIMFGVQNDQPVRLAAMPMEKFFNLNENPFTMDLGLTKVKKIELKADGSIMSTYVHNDQLRLKSKGSLFSTQAVDAMAWLDLQKNAYFKQLLEDFTFNGITVNLEWVAPYNRIVLGYLEPRLIVLNARDMETGQYADTWIFGDHNISSVDVNGITPVDFVASIPNMVDIEGYVIQLQSGQRVKIKTDWYKALHYQRSMLDSDKGLYELILHEAIDDFRTMFVDDVLIQQRIAAMEQHVTCTYNHIVETVEGFFAKNKNLERKEYAIEGQKKLSHNVFGLAMNKWTGKDVDYKQFMIKKYDDYKLPQSNLGCLLEE